MDEVKSNDTRYIKGKALAESDAACELERANIARLRQRLAAAEARLAISMATCDSALAAWQDSE